MTGAPPDLENRLQAYGFSPTAISRQGSLFAKAARALAHLGHRPDDSTASFFVPGRIEIAGKHTDYAGGRSLLCAVERGFAVLAVPRQDPRILIEDAADGQREEVALDSDLEVGSGWALYASTVARRLARDFPGASLGADIAFASDLPAAAGLSSSSALCVALFCALADANHLGGQAAFAAPGRSPEALAQYLAAIENGSVFAAFSPDFGVGAATGSEDQTAILCSRAGELAQYRFCPVARETTVALPTEWTFVVASSGVASDKTGAVRDRYNRLAASASAVLAVWNEATGRGDPDLLTAALSGKDAPEEIARVLRAASHPDFAPGQLQDRFEQFLLESLEVVPIAAAAIAARDATALGECMDRSQSAAENLLKNQIPETVALARSARSLGAIAASAFGGGFGGSVWALAPWEEANDFRSRWSTAYARDFPSRAADARFFATGAGPPACRIYPEIGGLSFQ